MSLSVYRIEDGEKHWVIAESERDALDQLKAAHMIDDYDTVEAYVAAEEPVIAALADADLLTLEVDGPEKETHTAAAWCAINGKGLLGSSVF